MGTPKQALSDLILVLDDQEAAEVIDFIERLR